MDSRFLTGGRGGNWNWPGSGDYYAYTRQYDVAASDSYQWILRSESDPGDGSLSYTDPHDSECVKFGDIVYLQVSSHCSAHFIRVLSFNV